jgi:beta-glucosidase
MRGTIRRTAVVAMVAAAGVLAAAPAAGAAPACGTHPWCDTHLAPARRAALAEAAMTTAEKLSLVAGGAAGVPRLGIPPLRGIDGPNGIGEGNRFVTAFPDAETLAASFDPSLARTYGRALGAEAAAKGFDWLFAPTINIVRTPLWGREAETLGEDPFLTASLVAPEIQGIQSAHVMAQVKHYAGNNQEVDRFGQPLGAPSIDDRVSERALQEIYFPGFRAAVQEGHVASVMCSYNQINGLPSCQNPATLGQLVAWGLQGFVGPDALLAVRDDVAAVNAGVDNMALGSLATATGSSELAILTSAYDSGRIPAARLNDAVARILTAMFAVGVVDHPPAGGPASRASTRAHLALATRVAEEATVLLRNRGGVLPLSSRGGTIAVIGADAGSGTQIEETGSPAVDHGPVITPLAGIRRIVGRRARVVYAPGTLGDVPLPSLPARVLMPSSGAGHGLTAHYYRGQSATGAPLLTRVDPTVDFAGAPAPLSPIPDAAGATAAVWTGTLTPPRTGLYRFSLEVSGVAALSLNGHTIVRGNAEWASADVPGSQITDPGGPTVTFQGRARLTRGRRVAIRIAYATGASVAGAELRVGWQPPDPALLARAVRAARHARVAIVFAGDVTSEGMDRTSLELPGDQDRLIAAVAAANPRTIVVLHTAGPVLMPWLGRVAAVLEAWYPGQQSGAAIAATLFGRSDPSGHLPVTFPRSGAQGPATTPASYPGIGGVVDYSEGILVGYRYYDAHGQTPLFPFGFGLSYTTFALGHLTVARTPAGERAALTVRNTGRYAGAEVVQAYLQFPAAAGEPARQLKAFARVMLAPGQARRVVLTLPRSSFTYYSTRRGAWVTAAGAYRLLVGTDERDLPLRATVTP